MAAYTRNLKHPRYIHPKSIKHGELVELIAATVGFGGRLRFNAEKPDGTLRKLTDPGRLQGLGWRHRVGLDEGVRRMYGWYVGDG